MSAQTPEVAPPVRVLGRFPVHPLLLAVWPALALWAVNVDEVQAGDVWPTVWMPALGAAVTWGIATAVLRSVARGAVVASIGVAAVLNGGRVGAFEDLTKLIAAGLLMVIVGVVLTGARRSTLLSLTAVANVLAVTLVLLALPPVVLHGDFGGTGIAQASDDSVAQRGSAGRDIWYIVPDRYPRTDTLTEQYGFDNSAFVDHLEELGFQVADRALANYPKTAHSLASTWNLAPIDDLVPDPPEDGGSWRPLYDLLQDHRLGQLVVDAGYEYLHLGSWWGPTADADSATRNLRVDTRTEFETVWQTQTLLPALLPDDGDQADPTLHDRNERYSSFQLDELDRLARRRAADDGAQFVLAHITQPHGPYVFRADGSIMTREEGLALTDEEGLLGQLLHLNGRLLSLVDQLTAGPPDTWPIIVIQSDEGPNPRAREVEGPAFDYTTASDDELERKLRTLSAILLPGSDLVLPEDLTGVDTWRYVLDEAIGTHFDPLDDPPIEVFAGEDELYELYDVADRVR